MYNRVDVAFVVDTTASMGGFLSEAKRRMRDMLKEISSTADIDLMAVLVDYRDHPPQEASYVTQVTTGKSPVDLTAFDRALASLSTNGGGDEAEAVLDGLDELNKIQWRPHSRRIAFLVGDAPGHGKHGSLTWSSGCPCGKTQESVSAGLETNGITLHGLVVNNSPAASEYFQGVARYTGGSMITGAGVAQVKALLQKEFGQLGVDKQVLDAVVADSNWSIDSLVGELNLSSGEVDGCLRRLIGRDLVTEPHAQA
jgi:hypothetical protein